MLTKGVCRALASDAPLRHGRAWRQMRHLKPGASPQEFELSRKQALKARFKLASPIELLPMMNRAFSAGILDLS